MYHIRLLFSTFTLLFLCLQIQVLSSAKSSNNNKKLVVDNLSDSKEFKKLLRTKTNVLVCFYYSPKQAQNVIKLVRDVAENIKGEGTMALVECSGEVKKMCKKLKISNNEPYVMKHYKDGEFNTDYDRKLTVNSMTNFMRDPTGDIPWEEDNTATYVVHIADSNSLSKLLKKESKPILIMFYAPWCGYCKTLKPEYAQAASELKDISVLAAIDVNRPENTGVRMQYNITGFPTMQYFLNGAMKFTYEGDNKKDAIVSFMLNPSSVPIKIKEPEWSDTDSEVVHLTASSFDPVIKEESSVLVMFYAPWCGHCKRMKPEYEKAAAEMKNEGLAGMLAAVDATKEQTIAARYSVKGYPTVIYFSYGEQKYDLNVRDAPKIIEFMRDPKEPPPPPPPEKPWSEEQSDVIHLNDETFKPVLKKKRHVLVIFYAPWCGHCKQAKPEFAEAAKEFRDDAKVEFAAVDCTIHSTLCSANDIKGYPTFKYFSYYNKAMKPYSGGRTRQDFIQYMSNPEMPSYTSSPPPAEDNDKWEREPSILHLNDSNFKRELRKNNLVLVMFYAPWCGHCQKMKPEYISAARQLRSEGFQNCLAMVDCTENRTLMNEYEIEGFPTIKLFKNGVFVKNYNGKRTVEDIKKFVREHYTKKDEL